MLDDRVGKLPCGVGVGVGYAVYVAAVSPVGAGGTTVYGRETARQLPTVGMADLAKTGPPIVRTPALHV